MSTKVIVVLLILLLVTAGAIYYFLSHRKKKEKDLMQQDDQNKKQKSTTEINQRNFKSDGLLTEMKNKLVNSKTNNDSTNFKPPQHSWFLHFKLGIYQFNCFFLI